MSRRAAIALLATFVLLLVGAIALDAGLSRSERAVRDCVGRPVFDHDGFRCEPVTP